MTMNELKEKLAKVENMQNLVDELQMAQTEEEAAKILSSYGVDAAAADLVNLFPEGDELTENDLDMIAGGCKCGIVRKIVIGIINWFGGMKISCCDSL